ncbi:F-box protein At3g07870-like [Mercurialis annua]|uniref:F-box protein At3g07870-like n=1 Tax=Mercurialis annua TaxID=3986 RepID=UPI0024AF8293|nr:F-box protein At3g07870-like [Mercurialis annua]
MRRSISNYLHEEVVVEILKRLPVKSLLKFRSVCKLWYSLITNPNFISLHLTHNKIDSLVWKNSAARSYEYTFVLHIYNDSFSELKQKFVMNSYIVGLCNGLVCLSDNRLYNRLIIWNPALREFITTSLRHCTNLFAGFGFDRQNNDYKVVNIVYDYYHYSKRYSSLPDIVQPDSVAIFELSSNVWRTITFKNLSCWVTNESCVYLNGVSHWLAQTYDGISTKRTILSFDLSNEAFKELMLPHALAEETNEVRILLKVYRQSLTVTHYERWRWIYRSYLQCSIWVMKDYGTPESWTKQFTIDLENHRGFKSVLNFQENGEILFVLRLDDEIISYDPKTRKVTRHGVYRSGLVVHSNYIESLVLLKGKRNIGNQLEG